MLVETISDALAMVEMGLDVAEMNIGGLQMETRKGKKRVAPYLNVDHIDFTALLALERHGIIIEARPTPNDKKLDVLKLLKDKDIFWVW